MSLIAALPGSRWLSQATDFLVGPPLQVAGIVVIAVVCRYLLHRATDRVSDRFGAGGRLEQRLDRIDARLAGAATGPGASPLLMERRVQRSKTLASVLKSLSTGVLGVSALLFVLKILGYSLGPVLASAGIAGVALGFGAQALVKDFLAGIFMLIEDQYGVGDVVTLGAAGDTTGVVDGVGLRVTRVRDADGTLWYVRNGEVLRVGNRSQGWTQTLVDVALARAADAERAQDVLLDVARGLERDPRTAPLVTGRPTIDAVEPAPPGAVVRIAIMTRPLEQEAVTARLRERISYRFAAEGIEPGEQDEKDGGRLKP